MISIAHDYDFKRACGRKTVKELLMFDQNWHSVEVAFFDVDTNAYYIFYKRNRN